MKEYEGELKALRAEMDMQVRRRRQRSGGASAAAASRVRSAAPRPTPAPDTHTHASLVSALPLLLPPPALAPLQRQILDKLREHEKGIDAEVEEIIGERRRCREVRAARWAGSCGTRRAVG